MDLLLYLILSAYFINTAACLLILGTIESHCNGFNSRMHFFVALAVPGIFLFRDMLRQLIHNFKELDWVYKEREWAYPHTPHHNRRSIKTEPPDTNYCKENCKKQRTVI